MGGVLLAIFIRGLLETNICYQFQPAKRKEGNIIFSLVLTYSHSNLSGCMQYTLNQPTVLILSCGPSSNRLEKNKEHRHDSFNFPLILNLGFPGGSVAESPPAV